MSVSDVSILNKIHTHKNQVTTYKIKLLISLQNYYFTHIIHKPIISFLFLIIKRKRKKTKGYYWFTYNMLKIIIFKGDQKIYFVRGNLIFVDVNFVENGDNNN